MDSKSVWNSVMYLTMFQTTISRSRLFEVDVPDSHLHFLYKGTIMQISRVGLLTCLKLGMYSCILLNKILTQQFIDFKAIPLNHSWVFQLLYCFQPELSDILFLDAHQLWIIIEGGFFLSFSLSFVCEVTSLFYAMLIARHIFQKRSSKTQVNMNHCFHRTFAIGYFKWILKHGKKLLVVKFICQLCSYVN